METPRFIADVHAGKLARLLRVLGIDVLYRNDYSKSHLQTLVKTDDRILLTKDALLARRLSPLSFVLDSSDSDLQLVQVVQAFALLRMFQPFTRCLVCNGELQIISKEEIAHRLLPKTTEYFNQFRICIQCNRLYWKGSHYDRMLKHMEQLLK